MVILLLVTGWLACLGGWVALVFHLAFRDDAPAYCPHSYERDCVPVVITLARGPVRVAWWCPECERTIYIASWLTRGEGEPAGTAPAPMLREPDLW